jgi:hypothetical protein
VLGNAAGYVHPPTELPASETTALGALDLHGLTFTNLPPAIPDYVSRATLESELLSVLTNDRHPIVSLIGRGGVGKTSLALEVLHRVTESERFMAILWFSSRDIDLLPEGPKLVRPDVLTDKDLAEQLVRLLDPMEQDHTGFDPIGYFARALTRFEAGPVLFVFDNFETVRSPSDLYGWLDVNIRLPNKILVTTRLRDFKAATRLRWAVCRRASSVSSWSRLRFASASHLLSHLSTSLSCTRKPMVTLMWAR